MTGFSTENSRKNIVCNSSGSPWANMLISMRKTMRIQFCACLICIYIYCLDPVHALRLSIKIAIGVFVCQSKVSWKETHEFFGRSC